MSDFKLKLQGAVANIKLKYGAHIFYGHFLIILPLPPWQGPLSLLRPYLPLSIYTMLCFIKCSTISLIVAKHSKDTSAQSPAKAVADIHNHLKLTGTQ